MKNRHRRNACILSISFFCFSLFCVFETGIARAQQIAADGGTPSYSVRPGADGEDKRLFGLLLDLIKGTAEEVELTAQSLEALAQSSSQGQSQLLTMITRLEGISRDLQVSSDALSRLTMQRASLESTQRNLFADFQGLANKLNALENETQVLKNYLRSSEDTLVRLQKKQGRQGPEKSGVLEESKRLVRELYDTNQHSRELNQKYAALKAEYDKLADQLFSSGDKSKDISGPAEQIALQLKTRQQELDKISSELSRTNTLISQYQNQIAALETRKKQTASVVEKEQELAGLAGQILQLKVNAENALNQTRIQKDAEVSKLKNQKDGQIAQLTAQLNEFKSQKDKWRAQCRAEQEAEAGKWKAQKEQELTKINGELAGLRAQKDSLAEKLNAQLARNNELLQAKAQKEQDILCLNAQIAQLKTEKDKGLQQIAGQKEKEAAQLKARIEEETVKLNVQMNLNAQLAQEKNTKEQELALSNRKLLESRGENKKLSEAYERMNMKKDAEILSLNNKISLFDKEMMNLQESFRQMTEEKAIFIAGQNQAASQIKSLQTQIAGLKSANEKLSEQNTFLKNDYVAASEKAANIKKEAAEMAKQKDTALGMLKQAQGRKAEKTSQRIPAERASFQQEYQALQQKYAELMQDNQSLKAQASESPKDALLAHYNLGVLYTQNKDYRRAVKEFERVLAYKRDDADSLYNLGVIYGEYMSDRKKGLEYFQRYLALAPNDADAEQVRKYILTWETLERQ